jgi:hypothetical protein
LTSSDVIRADARAVTELYPPLYDHAFFALVLLAVTLGVVALVRLWKSEDANLLSFVAFIVIVVVPIAGPTTYLYLTRRRPTPDPTPVMSR